MEAPEPSQEDDNDSACFPVNIAVEPEGGSLESMEAFAICDHVRVRAEVRFLGLHAHT